MDLGPYTDLMDALPEAAMLVVGGSGSIVGANRSARARFGAPADDWVGRTLYDIVSYPSDAELRAFLRACSRSRQPVIAGLRFDDSGAPYRAEGAVVRPREGPDGALVLLRVAPREDATHRFVALNERINELNAEIVRRRRSEAALEEQREWLQVTLSSIGDAVIITDVEGRVTFLNPPAEALTGWGTTEAAGRPSTEVFRIVNEVTREPAGDPIARVLETGAVVGLANHTALVARDGAEYAIEDTAAPIRNGPDGEIRGVVLVFHDIQERRRLERELEQRIQRLAEADRRKDEFLAMLAHELRNPLAPLQTGLHLLGRTGGDSDAVERIREVMDRQVRHLGRLVNDLLEVSRVSRGKITLHAEPLDIVQVVRETGDDHRVRMSDAGLAFELTVPCRAVWVTADRVRVGQILGNLLENALKFTPRGGTIRLDVVDRPAQVLVSVTDTGAGIDPALVPHLFEPFVQGDTTLARNRGGLGLGLALVKGLVELHGGEVRLGPGPGGRGTCVTFGLQRAATLPEPEQAELPTSRSGGRRVLVVDDNRDAAEMLGVWLQMSGHTVSLAYNGTDALAIARAERPEIVLCDIGLPDIDGLEVAGTLRGDPEVAGVRLIAITGYSDDAMRAQVAAAGFDAHLVKPVDPVLLLSALDPGAT